MHLSRKKNNMPAATARLQPSRRLLLLPNWVLKPPDPADSAPAMYIKKTFPDMLGGSSFVPFWLLHLHIPLMLPS